MKKIAFDVAYQATEARSVGLCFEEWNAAEATEIIIKNVAEIAPYEPGAFYKRELPCILAILNELDLSNIELIIVDGYVYLNQEQKKGLGAYLYEALQEKIPVIGLAKSSFKNADSFAEKVYRGDSKKPLYVSAIGIDQKEAAQCIREMHGSYRMPDLLQLLDRKTKEKLA